MLEREQQREPDDRLVAVIAEAETPIPGVGGEVPLHAGDAEVARQHLLYVSVPDAACPLEKSPVPCHRDKAHERLQVVAVKLGVRGGKLPEARRHGCLRHRVRREIDHAMEPGRASQVLGHADEAVLRVLAGAEEAGWARRAGREGQVAGDRRLGRREADFVSQHLEHPSFVQVGVGELRSQHEIRIEIGA